MLVAVFALGFVAGLRTLLAPAALLVMRGSTAGYVLAVGSLAELGLDLHPKAQSRTRPVALAGRILSGAVTGWLFVRFSGAGSPALGAVVGVVGALAGAFGGKAFRLWLIDRIGAVPAALVEDAIAVATAWVALALAGPR